MTSTRQEGERRTLARLSGVRKQFVQSGKLVHALDGVDFALRVGTIVGLFGNNGAGKTTIARLLTGLLDADEGSVTVCGVNMRERRGAAQGNTGLCAADERSFYPRLSGLENLVLFGALRGLDKAVTRARICDLCARLQISDALLARQFQSLSSGERQRFNIARALLNEPALLVVDEALRSADPATVERVTHLLRDYVRAGDRAVLYTGHEFHGVEDVCDEIAVLDKGRVLLHGPRDEVLRLAHASWRLEFESSSKVSAALDLAELRESRVVERAGRLAVLETQRSREVVGDLIRDPDVGLVRASLREHSSVRELLIEVAKGEAQLRAIADKPESHTNSEMLAVVRSSPSVVAALRALLRRDRLIYFSHRLQLFVHVGTMVLWAGLLFFVAKIIEPSSTEIQQLLHGDYFSYVIFGLALLQLSQVCLLQIGNALREEQLQGTLEVMLSSGRSPLLLLCGSLSWPLIMSFASMTVLLGAGALFFDVQLEQAAWGGVVIGTLLTTLVFSCLGIASAAFVLSFKRGDPIAKLLGLAALLVGGTYFPVETLPAWLRVIGELHPLTHGLRAVRVAALEGASIESPEYLRAATPLALMAIIALPLSMWTYRWALRYARQRGSLGHA